jgi:hypothetical protein
MRPIPWLLLRVDYWNIFYPFDVKNTLISCLLFSNLALYLSFEFVVGELTPLYLFVSCNPFSLLMNDVLKR